MTEPTTEAQHVFLPVSVTAVQELLAPHLPKGASVYSVGLTAHGALMEVMVRFPNGEYLAAGVVSQFGGPYALAAAWLTRWKARVDQIVCQHVSGEDPDPEDIAFYGGGQRHNA